MSARAAGERDTAGARADGGSRRSWRGRHRPVRNGCGSREPERIAIERPLLRRLKFILAAAALISVAVIAGAKVLGTALNNMFADLGTCLTTPNANSTACK